MPNDRANRCIQGPRVSINGLEVNSTSCCLNSQNCIIDDSGSFAVQCCALGSNCNNPCPTTAYVCPTTITVGSTSSVSQACCSRSCPVSSYKCENSLGGNCCGYGSSCVADGKCISTAVPATNQPVSVIPSGCITNQFACPSSQGGGCCDNGLACTVLSNTNYCAFATGTNVLTRTGLGGILATIASSSSSSKGLSTGAKAGIGAGVSVGALIVIALLYFFCVIHRRNARAQTQHQEESHPATSQVDGSAVAGSEAPNGSKAGSKRPPAERQISQPSDYFGPTAKPGPYTDRASYAQNVNAATSPGQQNRGVPAVPQSPGDIASPVEIDSRNPSDVHPTPLTDQYTTQVTPQHRFEMP
ncbi:hypothetical protein BJ875DRAFT_42615 [Amylocarpus encephaloides]|uniref:Uncharacterized protein n=1 Tax=Amylocarpus encephaloides TaxID=45428 RepID=A0A9P7YI51_9HELO|nr:hypothetical protein BJ875DRAFT_42615 [Amylocarpus encephaloides]